MNAASQVILDKLANVLKEYSDTNVLVVGHTDSVGADAMNMTLSKERAEVVKKQLIRLGIAAAQLTTDAKGETQPKEPNDTPEGRRANRRVAIVVQ